MMNKKQVAEKVKKSKRQQQKDIDRAKLTDKDCAIHSIKLVKEINFISDTKVKNELFNAVS